MSDEAGVNIAAPPSALAERLISRLAIGTGAGKLETAAVETSPNFDRDERIAAAEAVLRELAAGAKVDEEVIDRLIRDAEEALRKLESDGPGASLGEGQIFGLEAVIEADGSRPVLFVQDGTIDLKGPELRGSLAERWVGAASTFIEQIGNVASAVGAVQLPAMDNQRIGTAFVIAPGLIVTNRHVLEEVARFDGSRWNWKYKVEVDFVGENDRAEERRFPLVEVVWCGPNAINRTVNFRNLDLAVIRCGDGPKDFPRPLSFEKSVDRVRVGSQSKPSVYVMGFPAKPWLASGSPNEGAPPLGHEYQEVLEKLYANRFGSKRWAPGLVEAGAGQLAGDDRGWVMSHDASTLGGNSGSCVVDFKNNGERVVGLHFGGRPRVENYAHVVAALQAQLNEAAAPIVWI